MFDESVFPNASEFRLDRDPSTYLHFGFEYHKCLGIDVAQVMIPEMVKQLLKVKDLAIKEPLGSTDPFPEKFVLSYDASSIATQDSSLALPANWLTGLTFAEFVSSQIIHDKNRLQVIAAVKSATYDKEPMRSDALAKLRS